MANFKPLTADEVDFGLECIPDDMQIRGNCMASGDDELDEQCALDIERQLDDGNQWAWCIVKVTAAWRGFAGWDTLCGCSYKSEDDFCKPGDYFDDMKAESLAHLNQLVETAHRDALERTA